MNVLWTDVDRFTLFRTPPPFSTAIALKAKRKKIIIKENPCFSSKSEFLIDMDFTKSLRFNISDSQIL